MRGRDETVTITTELGGGAHGFVVIDTTVHNSSSGGLRITEDLTVEEVAALARAMTLKFSFIGRPSGGAKSGIRLAPGTGSGEKARVLAEFGRRMGPFLRRGIYSPGTDINCTGEELAIVYGGAGLTLGTPTDTAAFTAVSAADALTAYRESIGSPRAPLRLAIEGFGAVCAALAMRLPEDQFRVTALSTLRGAISNPRGWDAQALAQARRAHGDALVDHLEGVRAQRESVFSAEADVLVPSARAWSITPERAASVRARAVLPVANAPYAEGAIAVLEARGVTCLPGFVVNSGGIFGSSLFDSGVPLRSVERVSREHFRPVVRALLDSAARLHVSPTALAESVALERLARRQATTPAETTGQRVVRVLAQEYTPRLVRGARYLVRFQRNLAELEQELREHAPLPARGEPAAVA